MSITTYAAAGLLDMIGGLVFREQRQKGSQAEEKRGKKFWLSRETLKSFQERAFSRNIFKGHRERKKFAFLSFARFALCPLRPEKWYLACSYNFVIAWYQMRAHYVLAFPSQITTAIACLLCRWLASINIFDQCNNIQVPLSINTRTLWAVSCSAARTIVSGKVTKHCVELIQLASLNIVAQM